MEEKNKLVYGVGINDVEYKVFKYEKVDGKWKIVWRCPYYRKWTGVLQRCYSKKCQEKHPTYIGCTVCEEWLLFSNFKKWMERQEWEGRQLDKDFLTEGNKIYSPSTCIFIPQKLNLFTTTRAEARGQYPLGVSYRKKPKKMVNEHSKPYASMINNQVGKNVHLGHYAAPEEAHHVYLKAKLRQCESYFEEFEKEPLTIKGLTRIHSKIQFHIENNLELTSF